MWGGVLSTELLKLFLIFFFKFRKGTRYLMWYMRIWPLEILSVLDWIHSYCGLQDSCVTHANLLFFVINFFVYVCFSELKGQMRLPAFCSRLGRVLCFCLVPEAIISPFGLIKWKNPKMKMALINHQNLQKLYRKKCWGDRGEILR